MDWLGKIGKIASWSTGITDKVIGEVADRAISLVESEVTRYRSVEEELERLKRTSERINSLQIDAEQRRYIEDNSVKLWLSQLKSVSFDTDNLLDAYQTALKVHKLQNSLDAGFSHKRKWYQIDLPSLQSVSPEWGPVQRRRFSEEINRINNRLEEINNARKNLRLRGGDGTRKKPRHERSQHILTGPCHDPLSVIGRKHEKNEIVELLTSDLNLTLPVIPIYGTAGIGKTTLAKLVYDDQRIDEYYTLKAWVCLTDGCDVKKATKDIFEKLSGETCSFHALQDRLRYVYFSCSIHSLVRISYEFIHFSE
jgi:Rx N-terminal domain/NB-ARC domain